MNLVLSVIYAIGLYGAYLAGSLYLRTGSNSQAERQVPYATLLALLAITVPSTLQRFFPNLLQMFERDSTRFLAGDWWRIITPLFVQDGGLSGTLFNLVSLLLVGTVAEKLWGSQRWLILFFLGSIFSELIAFAWQPIGAGNSVANFSLAASIAVLCLTLNPSPVMRITSILALGAGLLLLFLMDIHGPAMIIGAGLALIMIWSDRHRFER
jgi:membrane associated rhomboid family serine protease